MAAKSPACDSLVELPHANDQGTEESQSSRPWPPLPPSTISKAWAAHHARRSLPSVIWIMSHQPWRAHVRAFLALLPRICIWAICRPAEGRFCRLSVSRRRSL